MIRVIICIAAAMAVACVIIATPGSEEVGKLLVVLFCADWGVRVGLWWWRKAVISALERHTR